MSELQPNEPWKELMGSAIGGWEARSYNIPNPEGSSGRVQDIRVWQENEVYIRQPYRDFFAAAIQNITVTVQVPQPGTAGPKRGSADRRELWLCDPVPRLIRCGPQCFQQVPVPPAGRVRHGPRSRVVPGTFRAAEAAGDPLLDLDGAQGAPGRVVGRGNGGIAGEPRHTFPTVPRSPHRIVAPSSFPPPPLSRRRGRRQGFVQGGTGGHDAVVTPADPVGQPRRPGAFRPTGCRRGWRAAAGGPSSRPGPLRRSRPGPGARAGDARRGGPARFRGC